MPTPARRSLHRDKFPFTAMVLHREEFPFTAVVLHREEFPFTAMSSSLLSVPLARST